MSLILWSALPAMITLFLLVIYLVPKHISGLGNFMPMLHMIPVFYWGLNYPRHMPYWFVFAIGLVIDAASGQPLGLTSFINVLFLAMIHAQHKYIHKEGFAIKWVYFGLLLSAAAFLHWLLIMLFYSKAPGVESALIQLLLTFFCYPIFHQLFDAIFYHMNQRRWIASIRK